MSKPTGINHSTLSWVKKELDETLKHAAEALEAHAEDPSDVTQLQFCGTHLHQVHGILQMLELFGAAMLVEEMEQVVEALVAEQVSTRQEAYEVLMRAILQLSDYLERIQGGLQDIPILILPLLNDLRAARGANLLTENALFSPNLEATAASPRRVRLGGGTLAERARKLRHRYQLGLLGFLREQNVPKSLQQMLEVMDKLDEASEDDQVGTVWWVSGGLVEALSLEAVDGSPAVKMLLGQVDRQIKRAADQGEESLSLEPPRELIKNLLYYVARAETLGERVPAIQAQYGLKDLLLDESELDQAREGLSGPNSDILRTVADAIKEDLTAVKDSLDLYARSGAKEPDRLAPIVDVLRRIGDTLGVLGLGVPRGVVKEQIALVEGLLRERTVPDEAGLMAMAESLLYVESALDGLTRRQPGDPANYLFSGESDHAEDRARSERELSEIEFKQIYGSAISEAMADVGRIKEAIVKFIEGGSGEELAELDGRFASVCGALRLLDLDRAALLLQAAGRYTAENVLPDAAAPDAEALDALADAITSIEYYLEAVRERHADPAPILDVAESGLERLGYLPGSDDAAEEAPLLEEAALLPDLALTEEPVAQEEPVGETFDAEISFDLELEEEPAGDGPAIEASAVVEEAEAPVEAAAEPTPAADPAVEPAPAAEVPVRKSGRINYDVPLVADALDQDILEIFTEEADEVLQTLASEYPRWRDNPEDGEALTTCRRMFHTLKGSGRLAGALLLGELAWTQENLLNRVLDNTVAPDPEIHRSIEGALALLPGLVEHIRGGDEPAIEPILRTMQRAEILSDPARRGELATLDAVAEGADAAEEVVLEAPDLEPEADEGAPSLDEAELQPQPDETGAAAPDLDWAGAELAEELVLDQEPAQSEELETQDFEIDFGEPPEPVAEEIVLEAAEPLEEAFAAEPEAFAEDEPAAEAPALELTEIEPVSLEEAPADAAEVEAPTEVLLIEAEPVMDPVLHDIFSRETADHLAAVRRYIEDTRAVGGTAPVTEALVRALHTLTGSARMAGVDNISRVGRKLEAYAEHHLAEERALTPRDLALLEQGVDLVEQLVAGLAGASTGVPDIEPLLRAVDAAASHACPPAEVEAEVPDAHEPEPAAAESGLEVDSDLVELFLEEAEDILRFLESTVQRWEDEPDHSSIISELHRSLHTLKGGARLAGFQGIGALCHALEGVSGDVADHKVPADDRFFGVLHASLDRLNDMVEQAKRGQRAGVPEDLLARIAEVRGGGKAVTLPPMPEQDLGGADKELIEVFLEEATEILEAQEAALHSWQEEPQNLELINEVQRALHTLKGGARMAGFLPIGNLSHALETLLIGVQGERIPVTPALFDLLERVHDRLFSMREKAAAGEALAEATDLLGAVEALREGRGGDCELGDEPQAAEEPHPAAPAAEEVEAADVAAAAPELAPVAAAPAPQVEPAKDERAQHDAVRVRADLLDNLVNFAGEVSIYRARLDQQVGAMRFNLTELDQTVSRLREQLRTLEIETEAQMLYRFEREQEIAGADVHEEFDPLEFDRFSRMQELSRALSESVNDLVSIQGLLDNLSREAETLLLQQSRVNTELQDGLMRTRMVPFANLVPRMRRIVRQTCNELGKQAQFKVLGAQGEMDRTVLERVTPPLEHMLRNAVAHGVESPEVRARSGKGPEGTITVALSREGADVVIRVSDDGGGIKLEAIRRKAVQMGLMPEKAPLSDREVMQFILEAGFSTAEQVTQIAGRGVGMDVVASEIKQLGGTLEIDSELGQATVFTIRLPFTLAINQALLCHAGEEVYAIPLTSIEGIARMTHEELEHCFANPHQAYYDYANERYEVRSLSQMLGVGEPVLPGAGKRSPIILVHTGDHRLAIQVDTLIGNREIVVKSVGPQISSVPGIQGATILADGRVVLILDVSSLVRLGLTNLLAQEMVISAPASAEERSGKPVVMVVDDSITMRKVATRLLERNGYDVVTAKDGVDAVARLQEVLPDGMLLDIEMPRMDGYELATHMRNDSRLKDVPIIMITSRTGEKHRQRAMEIGVNRYLGKPYQEADLLENLSQVLEESRGRG